MARAGDLADWLVRKSTLHPALRRTPMTYNYYMGNRPDPTVKGLEPFFAPLALQLQRAAHARALRLVRCARPAAAPAAPASLAPSRPPARRRRHDIAPPRSGLRLAGCGREPSKGAHGMRVGQRRPGVQRAEVMSAGAVST